MRIRDFTPAKGTFNPGDPAAFIIELAKGEERQPSCEAQLSIYDMEDRLTIITRSLDGDMNEDRLQMTWTPGKSVKGGFCARLRLVSLSGAVLDEQWTAFDVLEDWTDFPRYGFLTDFTPGRENLEPTIRYLARHHINGLQFYDWQYRHEELVPPHPTYSDPLGRTLSADTVRSFIQYGHDYGMKAMPYMAVYAASLPFWEKHRDWALYDEEGEGHQFEGFLGLMDPSPGGPWINHIREECDRVLDDFKFDGIHIDQYGEPRTGYNARGQEVDLPHSFTSFIGDLKEAHPERSIVFNAVKNWPIEALARSRTDFLYIEVWPPDTSYQDLARIVHQGRDLSGGKPVVIANYIPADHVANVRLADAVIYAAGGTRIEVGEKGRLLADPYFPEHEPIHPELEEVLHRYHDFHVGYGDVLGPSAARQYDNMVKAPPEVLTVVSRDPHRMCVSLVNFSGLENARWDESHSAPQPMAEIGIRIKSEGDIRTVTWGTPDSTDWQLQPLPWQDMNNEIQVKVPQLDYWSIIVINYGKKEHSA